LKAAGGEYFTANSLTVADLKVFMFLFTESETCAVKLNSQPLRVGSTRRAVQSGEVHRITIR
jgi:hypothetical protein